MTNKLTFTSFELNRYLFKKTIVIETNLNNTSKTYACKVMI